MNFRIRQFRWLFTLNLVTAVLFPISSQGEVFDCTREVPIFDSRAEGNRLPYGDYVMIRSFRNITQIIIHRDTYKTFVYTDHNNMLDGEITVSAFSEFDMKVSYPPVPSQEKFNRMLTEFLMDGYSANRMNLFRGMNSYNDRIKNGDYSLERFSDEYVVRIKENETEREILIDPVWKKLVVRAVKGGPEAARCPSVYADQTQDRIIRKVIYNFLGSIKKSRND